MKCTKPGCDGTMRTESIDSKTIRRVCDTCGQSQVVEAKDGPDSGRRMLTDDMPARGGEYLVEG